MHTLLLLLALGQRDASNLMPDVPPFVIN